MFIPRILYLGILSRVKQWKLVSNFKIEGDTKKNDKKIFKKENFTVREIRIIYFSRKKNKNYSTWNFQNN